MFTRQDIAQAPDMCLAILLRKSATSKQSLAAVIPSSGQLPQTINQLDDLTKSYKIMRDLGQVHGSVQAYEAVDKKSKKACTII